ncbi:hypothetical protein BLS_007449 [Venturia inaequalis]|uniref:Coatomer subunit gamma n=1 Tax=Venturia inaequalis TaxID=5025 RepID=A0A8H3U9R0_VENIN|nr:hypothetical protein BLS_007449 [Venturia inaequalis]KAE9985081.1 hypothetical protein EG328_007852 [Venturia inaequalis]KAE9990604.1 hypothetical protein EG327_001155 [Venturia inaequalis]
MDKKDEDAAVVKVDRTQVFQEARVFNSSPISPRKCRILLTKIGLLLFTGEKFPTNEATSLFFGISKLFQNKDPSLRQMVYIIIKELSNVAEDVIMITSSIMKDTALQSDVIYRANAIRALTRIIDSSTVQAIERLIKTAIVDKVPSVSSAALVSSYHLLPIARDVIRRWGNEVQSAVDGGKSGSLFGFGGSASVPQSTSFHGQYHALGLLYEMRKTDRMALVKMLQQYSQPGVIKSPAATMLLVRLASKLADEDQGLRTPMFKLLDGFLRHKSEMVNFEAAKAMASFPDLQPAEAVQAIHVLQLFLTSPRAVTKFAAIRILHNFASFMPDAVRPCNPDIEALISNSNRSIATFAITTLLKTGNEQSVDRLLKTISTFMGEISDEFKVTVVEAIRTLCLKFPAKQAQMLAFLSGILRDEGGFVFKQAVVESMMDLIKFVPDSKEDALGMLAEFIEDCEFTKLAVRIIHLLGEEGPYTSKPTKYIRYIYNRLLLENAVVRASAVTALAKFGLVEDAETRSSIRVLITRCLDDVDDEVRDRAALALRICDESEDRDFGKRFLRNDSMFSLPVLEHQLVMYVTNDDRDTFSSPFDLSKVPVVTRDQAAAEERTKKLTHATPTLKAPSAGPKTSKSSGEAAAASASVAQQKYVEQLQLIPELAAYGIVLKSSTPVELTESETEYVVSVVKHIFKEAIVLQFDIKNTLDATVLTDVTVMSTPEDEECGLEEDFIIPAAELKQNEPGVVYVAFKKPEGAFAATTFTNSLKFTSKEIDPTTNEPEESGYDDDYEVEPLDLTGADYVLPAYAGSFENVWVQSNGEEASETLQLSNIKSIADATEQLAKTLSLQPLEGSDVALSPSTHALKLYGKTVTGGKVAAIVRMAYSAKTGVTVQIKCRSEEDGVATLVVNSVA